MSSPVAGPSILPLLLELQNLDRVPRLGYSLRGVTDPESVAEHAFHVVFLVWALAGREPQLDRARAVEIALVHDLAEVRFGDLPKTAAHYLPVGAKASAERAALGDLLRPVISQRENAVELLDEYQGGASEEARFVKACDRLQLVIKAFAYHQAGNGRVEEFIAGLEGFDAGGFASLEGVVRELIREKSASKDPTA
ncbi:MAG: HD domain-containing protein [Acidobacteriota bacterium]